MSTLLWRQPLFQCYDAYPRIVASQIEQVNPTIKKFLVNPIQVARILTQQKYKYIVRGTEDYGDGYGIEKVRRYETL